MINIKYNNTDKIDIVENVYEGGQTLWECTLDLLQYNIPYAGHVIDMGCGLGLLGIQALNSGASVTFQDFNAETKATLQQQLELNNIQHEVDFVSGDWDQLQITPADIIVASEVIYRESNYRKVESFIARHLKQGGVCYMINKNYYFGVGGSVQGFIDSLTQLNVVERVPIKGNVKKTIIHLSLV